MSKKRKQRNPASFEHALTAYQEQRFAAAETILTELLEAGAPDYRVVHLSGLTAYRLNDFATAERMLQLATQLEPQSADAFCDLGNVLDESDKAEEAIRSYRKSLDLCADHPHAGRNLALTLLADEKAEEALDVLDTVHTGRPPDAPLYAARARVLESLERWEEAIEAAEFAVKESDGEVASYRKLVSLLRRSGQPDRAREAVNRWLQDHPNDSVALHLQSINQKQTVPRASDAYVRQMFDEFASRFDHELDALEYDGPQLISQDAREFLGEPNRSLAVLDAGCGTGKCGPILYPFAASLIGVDLSPKMTAIARETGMYTLLEVGELTDYMASRENQFDVIVAADTLNYFGNLFPVFAAAHAATKAAAHLFFTIEHSEDQEDGYQLNSRGRFTHRESYVHEQLELAKWNVVGSRFACLRKEAGKDVPCLVVAATSRRS